LQVSHPWVNKVPLLFYDLGSSLGIVFQFFTIAWKSLAETFESLDIDKMTTKFKMASKTYISIILPSNLQFSTDFKNLECIRSYQRWRHFWEKLLLQTFTNSKSNPVVQRSERSQKHWQRKFTKMADIFKMAFVLFSYFLLTVVIVLSSSFLGCLTIFDV
jgi:hypothetical protein